MKRIWVHTYVTGSAFNKRTIESVHHDEKEAYDQQALLGGSVEEFVAGAFETSFKVDWDGVKKAMDKMGIDSPDWFKEQHMLNTEPLYVQQLGRKLRGMEGRCIMVDFNEGEKNDSE